MRKLPVSPADATCDLNHTVAYTFTLAAGLGHFPARSPKEDATLALVQPIGNVWRRAPWGER